MRTAAIWALGILVAAFLAVGLVWPSLDRATRTQTVPDVASDGPVHVASDGRLVVVDRAGARVLGFDPASASTTALLGGLVDPAAADVDSTGMTCAADQVIAGDNRQVLRCGDGRNVDLSESMRPDGSRPGPSFPQDVVSDRHGSWFVSLASGDGANAVLRVTPDGRVEPAVVFLGCAGALADRPSGLAIGLDGAVLVGLEGGGMTVVSEDPVRSCDAITYLGGEGVVALIPRLPLPIVLSRRPEGASGPEGRIYQYRPFGHGESIEIHPWFNDPRGAALTDDGRIAVSAEGRLWIYRPTELPGE